MPSVKLYTLTFVLCLNLALFAACSKSSSSEPAQQNDETAATKQSSQMEEAFLFEEPDSPSHHVLQELLQQSSAPQINQPQDQRPKVAVIIDDMGHHHNLGEQLLALELNVTFSFLPGAPYTLELAQEAFSKHRDILIHLPMEPKGQRWNPGTDALLISESPSQLAQKTAFLLGQVPHAIGVNNHMGSLFTEQKAAMKNVLSVIQQQDLFFVDSFTTAQSVGFSTAQSMHIPSARRHVFIDNVQDAQKICAQIDQLVQIAQEKGAAIGIGHPHKATLEALTLCGQDLVENVQLVGVHELVH